MTITRTALSLAGDIVDSNATLTISTLAKTGGTLFAAGDVLILGVVRYSGSADLPVAGDCTRTGGATVGTITLDKVADINFSGTEHVYACIYRIPITGSGALDLQVAGGTGNYWAWGGICYTPSASLSFSSIPAISTLTTSLSSIS